MIRDILAVNHINIRVLHNSEMNMKHTPRPCLGQGRNSEENHGKTFRHSGQKQERGLQGPVMSA